MRRSSLTLRALVTALALLAAACSRGGQEPDSGAEGQGKPIVIGAVFDLSGITSDIGTPYSEGIRDYIDWRNSHGGVSGRPIDLRWQDYRYEVPEAERLYTQYVSEGAVAFLGWGTGDTEALRARIADDQVPFMSVSYAATLTDPNKTPYNFVVALSYSNQMRLALQYIADQAQGKHVEVAVFHIDAPAGTSPLEDGRSYIAQKSLDIGYDTYAMARGATDFVGELTRAERQGADYIIVQQTSAPAATLAKNMRDQGLDAQIVCLNYCADELFVEQAGEAAEGALGIVPFAPPAHADSDISDLEAFLQTKGSSLAETNLHYTQGWYTMHVMAEGIANVVASGQEVTGPAIKAALESMGPIDTPVTSAIQFSPNDHEGMASARIYQVIGGTWSPVTGDLIP